MSLVKSINEGWEDFKTTVIEPNVLPGSEKELRAVFGAGALVAYMAIMRNLADAPGVEVDANNILDIVHDQITKFNDTTIGRETPEPTRQ